MQLKKQEAIMTDKKPILLMDLDNTLLDFDQQEEAAISKMLLERGIEPTAELLRIFREINVRHWEMLETGELTRAQVLVGRFRVFFDRLGYDLDAQSAEDSYAGHLCEGHYFVPGAQELLDALYGHYDMYIISNGNSKVQAARLASSGISKYFNDIFISEDMGHNKPSREYFNLCFEKIPDFQPENALIIGDSLTSDIRGGINMGIRTCWFNPKHQPAREDIPSDFTVYSLDEIPDLLARIFGGERRQNE